MPAFTDQLGRTIHLSSTPKRIISLVPSQTELLSDLGLGEEVVGITKFCIHPEEWFRTKTRVGGTKQLHLEVIRSLNPDLVIANKEENVREQVEELEKEFPVWTSDVNNLDEALDMIQSIGEMVNKTEAARQWVTRIQSAFGRLADRQPSPGAAYLIWKDPYMTVGRDTFIHDMMQRAGFRNRFEEGLRYPEVEIKDLKDCAYVLLSSEPFPFSEKHKEELQQQLPHSHILLVDGEAFSWYGSRLDSSPEYFERIRQQIGPIS